jgi:hypothetical protein
MWKWLLVFPILFGGGPSTEDMLKRDAYVVPLYHVAADHESYFCSATVVSVDPPVLLTEEHCLRITESGGITPLITAGGPREQAGTHIEVLGEHHGIVALRTGGRHSSWRALKVRKDPLRPGDTLKAFGYAYNGITVSMSTGTVFNPSDAEMDTSLNPNVKNYGLNLYMDITQLGGMSGGPVVDEDGRLVTLVRRRLQDGAGRIGLSAPLEYMQEAVAAAIEKAKTMTTLVTGFGGS